MQCFAVHVLHDQPQLVFGLDNVEQLHDIGMQDPRVQPSFLHESNAKEWVFRELWMKALDRDEPRKLCGAGQYPEMNRAHAADRDQRVETIATNLGSALSGCATPTRKEGNGQRRRGG